MTASSKTFVRNGHLHTLAVFSVAIIGIVCSSYFISIQYLQVNEHLQECAIFNQTDYLSRHYNWYNQHGQLNPVSAEVSTSFFFTSYHLLFFALFLHGIFSYVFSANEEDKFNVQKKTPNYRLKYPGAWKKLYENKCLLIFRLIGAIWFYAYISYRLITEFLIVQSLTEWSKGQVVNPPVPWNNFPHFYLTFFVWWFCILNVLIWIVVGIAKSLGCGRTATDEQDIEMSTESEYSDVEMSDSEYNEESSYINA